MNRRKGISPRWIGVFGVVVILMSHWVVRLNNDLEDVEFDRDMYKLSSERKDTTIQNLSHKIDSLKKIPQTIDTIKISDTKSKSKKITTELVKNDTIDLIRDSIKLNIDTLTNDSIK